MPQSTLAEAALQICMPATIHPTTHRGGAGRLEGQMLPTPPGAMYNTVRDPSAGGWHSTHRAAGWPLARGVSVQQK